MLAKGKDSSKAEVPLKKGKSFNESNEDDAYWEQRAMAAKAARKQRVHDDTQEARGRTNYPTQKVKFCMYHLQGVCKYRGNDCAFAHSTEEMVRNRDSRRKRPGPPGAAASGGGRRGGGQGFSEGPAAGALRGPAAADVGRAPYGTWHGAEADIGRAPYGNWPGAAADVGLAPYGSWHGAEADVGRAPYGTWPGAAADVGLAPYGTWPGGAAATGSVREGRPTVAAAMNMRVNAPKGTVPGPSGRVRAEDALPTPTLISNGCGGRVRTEGALPTPLEFDQAKSGWPKLKEPMFVQPKAVATPVAAQCYAEIAAAGPPAPLLSEGGFPPHALELLQQQQALEALMNSQGRIEQGGMPLVASPRLPTEGPADQEVGVAVDYAILEDIAQSVRSLSNAIGKLSRQVPVAQSPCDSGPLPFGIAPMFGIPPHMLTENGTSMEVFTPVPSLKHTMLAPPPGLEPAFGG